LEKNSDLSSLKCYRKSGKNSESKFKIQKKMINQKQSVCNSGAEKNSEATVILKNLSQLIAALFSVILVPNLR